MQNRLVRFHFYTPALRLAVVESSLPKKVLLAVKREKSLDIYTGVTLDNGVLENGVFSAVMETISQAPTVQYTDRKK